MKCKGIWGFLFGHKIVSAYDTITTPPEPNEELRKTLDNLKVTSKSEQYDHMTPLRVNERINKVLRATTQKKLISTYCKRCGLKI